MKTQTLKYANKLMSSVVKSPRGDKRWINRDKNDLKGFFVMYYFLFLLHLPGSLSGPVAQSDARSSGDGYLFVCNEV